MAFEATQHSDRPDDVREVLNYMDALAHTRARISDPQGLPISTRLLCEAHRILMAGVRGENKLPGELRRSQNWIGGSRPGNAHFVPPPPDEVVSALSALERWLHGEHELPPLVRIGLAHVQFETIHPFLDGNGRIGRLLIALLLELLGPARPASALPQFGLETETKQEYYARLDAVRQTLETGKAGPCFSWTACRQPPPTECVSRGLFTR